MAEAGEQVRNPAAAGEGPRKGDSEEGRESSVPEDEQQGDDSDPGEAPGDCAGMGRSEVDASSPGDGTELDRSEVDVSSPGGCAGVGRSEMGGECESQQSHPESQREIQDVDIQTSTVPDSKSGSHETPVMNSREDPGDSKEFTTPEKEEEEEAEEEEEEEEDEEEEEEEEDEEEGRREDTRKRTHDSEVDDLEEEGERTCERAEEEDAGHTASRDCLDNEWDAVEGGRKDPKCEDGDQREDGDQHEDGDQREDGEDVKEGDPPEASPMFVPTKGKFFQHDDRLLPGEEEGEEQQQLPPEEPKSRADIVDKWQHDLYVESEQGPREQWEKDRDARISAEYEARGGRRGGGRRGVQLGSFISEEDQERFDSRRRRRDPRRSEYDQRERDSQPRRHGERSGRREWAMEREEGGRERWQRSDRPRRREGYRESESGRSNHRERKEDRNTSDGSWGTPAENGKEWEGDSTTPSNATTVQNNRPLPKTNWSDIDEDEDSRGTALQKDGAERVHSGSAAVSAQPEKERGDSHNMTNGGDAKPGSRSLFSVQSGSGGGSKAHQTKVFSLSQESKLVVKSDEKGKESTSSRVRGRGRGWRERLGPPQVGASRQSPSQAGSGVTVIEPLEKRLVQDQTESATEGSTFGSPGLPLGAKMESLQHQQDRTDISQEEGEGKSEDSVPPPPVVMQASLMQASKPKRYSSQRQKSGQSGEQQLEPQQWRQQPGEKRERSWVPTSHMDPAVYQEMIAQQIKMLQLQQQMVATPSDLSTQMAVLQQNPMFFQQMQQYLWLQHQYQQQPPQPYPQQQPPQPYPQQQPPQPYPQQQPPQPYPQQQGVVVNRPVDASELPGYPQQMSAPVPQPPHRPLDREGVKQGYTSPGGLFIPPVAVDEQRRHYQSPQQVIQKPRSQAIPIVPPKEGD